MIRLNKYLSDCGVCSRREADTYIAAGRVQVNGHVACMGEKVSGQEDICLDRKPVNKSVEAKTYILLNKPRGIVCTTKNDKDNVIDFLKLDRRVFPVGRLDKDSQGLLLLTDDGSIVNDMMRAGNFHEKEYVVQVDRPFGTGFIKQMQHGVFLEELGVTTRPCKVKKIGETTFRIVLTQGLNRQIRRMCQTLGFKVRSLKRVRIMNLFLADLPEGQWRYITPEELKQLKSMITGRSNSHGKTKRI